MWPWALQVFIPGTLFYCVDGKAKVARRFPYWSASPPQPRKTAWFSHNGVVVLPILSSLLPVTACVATGAFVVQDLGPEASVSGGQWIGSGKPGKSSPEDESLRVSRCCTTKIGLWIGITNPLPPSLVSGDLLELGSVFLGTNQRDALWPRLAAQCFPLDAAFLLFPACLAAGLLQ